MNTYKDLFKHFNSCQVISRAEFEKLNQITDYQEFKAEFEKLYRIWKVRKLQADNREDRIMGDEANQMNRIMRNWLVKNPQIIQGQLKGLNNEQRNAWYFKNKAIYEQHDLLEFYHETFINTP